MSAESAALLNKVTLQQTHSHSLNTKSIISAFSQLPNSLLLNVLQALAIFCDCCYCTPFSFDWHWTLTIYNAFNHNPPCLLVTPTFEFVINSNHWSDCSSWLSFYTLIITRNQRIQRVRDIQFSSMQTDRAQRDPAHGWKGVFFLYTEA